MEEELSENNELEGFDSSDGKHHVIWGEWQDEGHDLRYDTWVCVTHGTAYYGVCAQKD